MFPVFKVDFILSKEIGWWISALKMLIFTIDILNAIVSELGECFEASCYEGRRVMVK